MSVCSAGLEGRGTGRLCLGCNQMKLRTSELHDSCFDCLSHGPQTPAERRCEICRSWTGKHFIQSTHYYPSDSPAKLAASALRASECTLPRNEPPPSPYSPSQSVGNGGLVLNVDASQTKVVTPVTSSLNVTVAPISQDTTQLGQISSVLASLVSLLKGPQLAGLPALLHQGVPIGAPPALSGQFTQVQGYPVTGTQGQGGCPSLPSLPAKRPLDTTLVGSKGSVFQVKKAKSSLMGQPADFPGSQDTGNVVVTEHVQGESFEERAFRAVPPFPVPFTQVEGSDQVDQGPPSLSLGAFSVPPRDHPDQGSRSSPDQAWGQSSSGAQLGHDVDASDRDRDQQAGHGAMGPGQTRPNCTHSTLLPVPLSDRGGRSRGDRVGNSFPCPTQGGTSVSIARSIVSDVEMLPDDRVAGEYPSTESGMGDSLFRWALGSIAQRMGVEQPQGPTCTG